MKKIFKVLACVALFAVIVPTVSHGQAEDTRTVMKSFVDSIQQNNDKITINIVDPNLNIAEGNVEGIDIVNKFGRAPSGIQTTATDIWDRATAAPLQSVWIKPTQARIHQIVSDSTDDDGAPVGLGARTIRVYGLTDWESGEIYEDITLNGTTNVPTVLSYVVIHRMKVLTHGATSVNVGAISATADTDSTVTAQINDGEGQTQMAIYGIPSSQKLMLDDWYGSINKASGANAHATFSLLINDDPEIGTSTGYRTRNTRGLQSTGNSSDLWPWPRCLVVNGPAIVKASAQASANDVESSGGFNGVLIDNNNNNPTNLAGGGISDGFKLADTQGRYLLPD